jgi:hypothetical protein
VFRFSSPRTSSEPLHIDFEQIPKWVAVASGKLVDRDARIRRADELGKKVVDNSEMRPTRTIQRFGLLECVDVQARGLHGPACKTQRRLQSHTIFEQQAKQVSELRSNIGTAARLAASQ